MDCLAALYIIMAAAGLYLALTDRFGDGWK